MSCRESKADLINRIAGLIIENKDLKDADELRASILVKFQDKNEALKEIGEGLLIVIKSVYIRYPKYTELKNVIREATLALKGETK